jgi:hypothetical protein
MRLTWLAASVESFIIMDGMVVQRGSTSLTIAKPD